MPNWANDIRNGTIGVRKRNSWRARPRHEILRSARYREYGGKHSGNCYSHHIASVQSALHRLSLNFRHDLAAPRPKRPVNTPKASFYDHHLWGLPTLRVYVFQFLVWIEHKIGVEIARVQHCSRRRCSPRIRPHIAILRQEPWKRTGRVEEC